MLRLQRCKVAQKHGTAAEQHRPGLLQKGVVDVHVKGINGSVHSRQEGGEERAAAGVACLGRCRGCVFGICILCSVQGLTPPAAANVLQVTEVNEELDVAVLGDAPAVCVGALQKRLVVFPEGETQLRRE